MSPRALRRAAERQAAKLAEKATLVMTATVNGDPQLPPPSPSPAVDFQEQEDGHTPISAARLAANRANAQLSCGPKTPEGKAKSSLNAVKTGLTGRTVLLPSDDAIVYQRHLNRRFSKYSPVTDEERDLVQSIADTDWRLLRIAPLEASIYSIGRRELAEQVADEPDPTNREALLQGKIFIAFRRDLSNLALQERRLRSQRLADIAELQSLQQERINRKKELAKNRPGEIVRAITIRSKALEHKMEFDPAAHGFDFSDEELTHYLHQNAIHYKLTGESPDFDEVIKSYRAAKQEAHAA